jgi:hypothetical protein
MISREETVTFVWRCPDCSGTYEGEGLLFLHTDGVHRYCPCGGQLVEGVEPAAKRREAGEAVEVTVGGRLDRHINIFSGN